MSNIHIWRLFATPHVCYEVLKVGMNPIQNKNSRRPSICKHWHPPCQACLQRVIEGKTFLLLCTFASSVARCIMRVGDSIMLSLDVPVVQVSVENENCQEAVFGLIRSEFWLCKCKHWHFPCQPCRQRVTERENRPIRCAVASSVAQRIMWVGNRPV